MKLDVVWPSVECQGHTDTKSSSQLSYWSRESTIIMIIGVLCKISTGRKNSELDGELQLCRPCSCWVLMCQVTQVASRNRNSLRAANCPCWGHIGYGRVRCRVYERFDPDLFSTTCGGNACWTLGKKTCPACRTSQTRSGWLKKGELDYHVTNQVPRS